MKVTRLLSGIIFCALLFSSQMTFAMRGGDDPLNRIDYSYAFDHGDIDKTFADTLRALGCHNNVARQEVKNEESKDVVVEMKEVAPIVADQKEVSATNLTQNQNYQAYKKACLARLKSARRWALTTPARERGTLFALMVLMTLTMCKLIGSDSLGGSFGIFALFSSLTYVLKSAIQSGYNLAYTPAHPLDRFEKLFAENQCFIPKVLWPAIIEKFMVARSNQFEQRGAINFIEFALGLTLHKPKLKMQVNSEAAIGLLAQQIDRFFLNYEELAAVDLWRIKINVGKFIQMLFGDKKNASQGPRYIYLSGPGGIGKTYFARKLNEWIRALFGACVRLENLTIDSPEKLEGNAEQQGAFLCVLRNQLMDESAIGSIVFIDEANWLNQEGMVSVAKRVFNGDQSRISTAYFGKGVEGKGISLEIPPMLIIVANNEDIKDEALASRFDVIKFPNPKKEATTAHALKAAEDSAILPTLLRLKHVEVDQKKLESSVSKIKTFREAQALAESLAMNCCHAPSSTSCQSGLTATSLSSFGLNSPSPLLSTLSSGSVCTLTTAVAQSPSEDASKSESLPLLSPNS